MAHQTTFCAALGHFIGSVHLIYCPHEQAWTLVYSAGTDADDTLYEHATRRLGPFDQTEDAIALARALMRSVIDVRVRQFLREVETGTDTGPDAPGALF